MGLKKSFVCIRMLESTRDRERRRWTGNHEFCICLDCVTLCVIYIHGQRTPSTKTLFNIKVDDWCCTCTWQRLASYACIYIYPCSSCRVDVCLFSLSMYEWCAGSLDWRFLFLTIYINIVCVSPLGNMSISHKKAMQCSIFIPLQVCLHKGASADHDSPVRILWNVVLPWYWSETLMMHILPMF